jgi:hypothetical protein
MDIPVRFITGINSRNYEINDTNFFLFLLLYYLKTNHCKKFNDEKKRKKEGMRNYASIGTGACHSGL